jgi:N-acetylglucosamine kinase-like BadF-type ATPase
MTYIFGIDGGGTKTHCIIGTLTGDILGQGFGGQGNYQTCGIETTKQSIKDAFEAALEQAHLKATDLSYGVLGLSGADETRDFEVLVPMCKEVFGNIPHEVMNDTWIGLRTGSSFGVISICGTGGAHAGKNPEGRQVILRNMDYPLGNRGGGGEIVEKAIHFAFRSHEDTYIKSDLEKVMPTIFKVKTMDQVAEIIRSEGISNYAAYQIPIETFKLAEAGDVVSREIIEEMSVSLGQFAASVVRKLHMEDLEVPMVLIGSLFRTRSPLMLDPYIKQVQETAPKAYCVVPTISPAEGALHLAIEAIQT